jgi:HTH-type transcriptional regulator/antitoxin HipB
MDYPVRTPEQLELLFKAFRKSRGLSQQELAQRIGVTQQALSLLEGAPQRASVERLIEVLSVLGVEVILRENESPGTTPSGEW